LLPQNGRDPPGRIQHQIDAARSKDQATRRRKSIKQNREAEHEYGYESAPQKTWGFWKSHCQFEEGNEFGGHLESSKPNEQIAAARWEQTAQWYEPAAGGGGPGAIPERDERVAPEQLQSKYIESGHFW